MTHPFFSELNETLICEHKTNSWNTDDTTPYHCHDGYEILVFISYHLYCNKTFTANQHQFVIISL